MVSRRAARLRRVRVSRRAVLLCLCALALGAGGRGARSAAPADGVKPGTYRVAMETPGGELPFGLDLTRTGAGWAGYLVNGRERVKLDEVTVVGAELDIKMPGYENRLHAEAQGDQLHGELVLDKLGGKDQHIPLSAQFGQHYRFFREPQGGPQPVGAAQSGGAPQPGGGPRPGAADVTIPDVAGRWAVTFTEEGGKGEPAVAEFSQTRDEVTGTILTATGDHRFLAGQVRGDELDLSTFDGAHVFLYKAKIVGPQHALAGDFWSGSAYHERFTANRDAHAALPDAYALTTLREGVSGFDFAFPDVTGQLVASTDPKFRNKVVIVALAGSWCPNCHDEAAFLAPLYRDYRDQGLEIVSLMFEHFGDFERAAAATGRFRQHYGIEYTTLIAGISDKDEASKKLPMLTRVYAFPTTIVIDRKGRVRMIHTGYSGPATGEHYTRFVAEFKSTVARLLAET
jgi:peroxiredoxin